VEISTSKGSIGSIQVSSLKVEKAKEQAKEKALPLEIDEVRGTIQLSQA